MKNRNIGILLGLLPFLVITLTLFARSSVENTLLTSNAVAQPYPYLQPFPSTSQIQQSQQPLQQQLPNTATSVLNSNNNNNPFQNLQNQIDQLKAIISNSHLQPKLVVTERSAPDFSYSGETNIPVESKAVCNSDELATGGGYEMQGQGNSQFAIWNNSASGNGWSVIGAGGAVTFKAVAMCAKLT